MLRSKTDHLQVRKQKHRTVFTRHTIENCKMIVIVIYIICEVSQKLLTLFCLVFKDFCFETPEGDQLLIETRSVSNNNKGLCLTEITLVDVWGFVAANPHLHWLLRFSLFLALLIMFTELRNATLSFVISVSPFGTTRLPLDRFSWNFIFEYFSKICRENSSFITIF
jgi:hypothetical protein